MLYEFSFFSSTNFTWKLADKLIFKHDPWAPPPKTLVQTFWRIRAQESDVLTHIQHNVDANYALRLSPQGSPGQFRTDGADFFTAQQIQLNILNMQQLFDRKES